MKIAEEGALTDFDRRTGRPQTERGRNLAPKKKYLGDEERSQLDKLTDRYGSYANIPKQFKAQFKEGKGINSMITRERLEEILREEIVAVTEGRNDAGSLYREAAADKPAKTKGKLGYFDGMVGGTLGTLAATNVDKIQAFAEKLGNVVDNVTNPEVLNQIMQLLQQASSAVMEGIPDMSWRDDQPNPIDLISFSPAADASKHAAPKKRRVKKQSRGPWQHPGLLPQDDPELKEDATLTELLNLLEGHMGQEAPPVENDQRARELLDGFKNMLKPQERAEPSACATFLRQLADMAEREGGAPDAGTMPEPLPNN